MAGCSRWLWRVLSRGTGTMAEILLQVKPKLMGALQVVLGVAHLGFGGVAASIAGSSFTPWSVTATTAYPFWGGILFIASGSLLLVAERYPKPLLVKSSLGANACSAVTAGVGVIFLIADLSITAMYGHPASLSPASTRLLGMLLFTSFLELAITALLCCRGYLAARCPPQPVPFSVPYTISNNPSDLPIAPSAPPAYSYEGYSPSCHGGSLAG